MQSPWLLAFIVVMVLVALVTGITLLVRRSKDSLRGKEHLQQDSTPETDMPALVVQTGGEGAGPRYDDDRGHGSDDIYAPRPAPGAGVKSHQPPTRGQED